MATMLKRACRSCGTKGVVQAITLTEPNEVEWETDPVTGFEREIVLSTQRSRYTHCTYCGARYDA